MPAEVSYPPGLAGYTPDRRLDELMTETSQMSYPKVDD
jgi:hypothetical protein